MYNIIIIDDEIEISSGFAQFFPWKQLGYRVVRQFTGAKEALEYIQTHPLDVVISDVIMPGMTGIDLARELSKMENRPLLLIFSAYDEFKYAQQALKYGCTDYILKTTEYDELIAIFAQLKNKLDESRGCAMQEDTPFKDQIIENIRAYVEKNLADASLEKAAAEVYMSPSYISRYFKQKTGCNFADYVMTKRMEKASEMLADMRYKIYDISESLGYRNSFNFTRSFKKYYGVSPRDYRFQKLGRVLLEDEEDFE